MYVGHLVFIQEAAMSISSLLLMTTLRYGYVYLMKKKSGTLDKFKEFKTKSEKQLGRHIKSLRSDGGGKYMFIEFVSFHKEHEILS